MVVIPQAAKAFPWPSVPLLSVKTRSLGGGPSYICGSFPHTLCYIGVSLSGKPSGSYWTLSAGLQFFDIPWKFPFPSLGICLWTLLLHLTGRDQEWPERLAVSQWAARRASGGKKIPWGWGGGVIWAKRKFPGLGQQQETKPRSLPSSLSASNDLRGNRTAVISQIRWQVTATDVPSICTELITH